MRDDIKICVDIIDDYSLSGWFINHNTPEDNQLLLYVDDKYKAMVLADLEREDVKAVHGQLLCGFSFDIEPFSGFKHLKLKSADKTVLFTYKNKAENITPPLDLTAPYSQQRHQQLQRLKIDLSKPINGNNWYDIELTGRWGGPKLKSDLIIPALVAGNYELKLKIDNHFCGLETMKVLLNDEPVKFLNTEFPVPVVLQANIEIKKDLSCWTLTFHYSKTYSPEMEQRKLAIFLETITFTKIIPSNLSL